MLRDILTASDLFEQERCFLAASMIEEHRDGRTQRFFRGVTVNTSRASIPTHDHAFSGDADDCVAGNVDNALQAGEFVADTRELFLVALPTSPNQQAGGYLKDKQDNNKFSEVRSEECL